MAQEVVIEILEDGTIIHKTTGFKGKSCLNFLYKLKTALKNMGIKIDTEQTTPTQEMYETPVSENGHMVKQ